MTGANARRGCAPPTLRSSNTPPLVPLAAESAMTLSCASRLSACASSGGIAPVRCSNRPPDCPNTLDIRVNGRSSASNLAARVVAPLPSSARLGFGGTVGNDSRGAAVDAHASCAMPTPNPDMATALSCLLCPQAQPATTFMSGSPASRRSRLVMKKRACRCSQSTTRSLMCGVINTLSRCHSGLESGSGSVAKTSR